MAGRLGSHPGGSPAVWTAVHGCGESLARLGRLVESYGHGGLSKQTKDKFLGF